MASIVTQILLLALVIHVVLASENGVKLLGGVVGGLTDNIAKTVVCLQENALNILIDLLNSLSLNNLSSLLGTILTTLLAPVIGLLQQIFGVVNAIAGVLNL